MIDKLTSMRVFCRVAELGSFVAVAREEELSTTMISKHVASLEKRLGVTLLNRTTRKVNLTDIGFEYYQQAKQLLADLRDLDDSMSQKGGVPGGALKLIAPVDFGELYLGGAVEAYQSRYPNVRVKLLLSNQEIDLSEGRYDIAIRVTDVLDEGVVARPIATTELCTFASAGYLSLHGEPKTLEELKNHRCLHFLNTPHGERWPFQCEGKFVAFKPSWHFSTNNGTILCEAAGRGMGIVQVPKMTAARYLARGELIEILHEFRIPQLKIYAIYQQRRYLPAKISTFIEALSEYLGRHAEIR